jgi:hypothetical protein
LVFEGVSWIQKYVAQKTKGELLPQMEIEMEQTTDERMYDEVDIYEEKSIKAKIKLCTINYIEGFK